MREAPRLRRFLAVAVPAVFVIVALTSAIAGTAAAASPSPVSSASPSVAASPVAPSATPVPGSGAAIYAQNCSGCHGRDGKGYLCPSLAADGSAELVADMVRRGGTFASLPTLSMPSFSSFLSPQEIQAVAAFVSQQLADPASHAASVAEGGQIYRLYCSGCHDTTGRGGALIRGINAPSVARFPAAASLAAMILGPSNMPIFADNSLDVRQQASVALYVEVLQSPPSPGGNGLGFLGPVTEGFAAGGALGLIVLLAVWLSWGKGGAARDE